MRGGKGGGEEGKERKERGGREVVEGNGREVCCRSHI